MNSSEGEDAMRDAVQHQKTSKRMDSGLLYYTLSIQIKNDPVLDESRARIHAEIPPLGKSLSTKFGNQARQSKKVMLAPKWPIMPTPTYLTGQ